MEERDTGQKKKMLPSWIGLGFMSQNGINTLKLKSPEEHKRA